MRTGRRLNVWDWRSITNLAVLVVVTGCYVLYLHELFFGSWDKIHTKAFYYTVTGCFLLYLIIDELCGYSTRTHRETNLICKFSLLANFVLFALILTDQLSNPKLCLYLLNGCIFVLSFIILFTGVRHEFFKD